MTLGDPAGVGPEIVVRLFERGGFPENVAPFVVGEARHLAEIAAILAREDAKRGATTTSPPLRVERLADPPRQPAPPGTIPVIEPSDFRFEGDLAVGKVSAQCGAAAWAYVRCAVALVQAGRADAIVTAPLHKEALQAAGCPYAGHTEMLADLADGARVAMLLVGGGLRVALATIHEQLARVPALLTEEGILEKLRLLDHFIPWFGLADRGSARSVGGTAHGNIGPARPSPDPSRAGIGLVRPRIGVAGLNPHAGEGGLFGNEERLVIAPAVERARAEGIDATGPLPGDTIFHAHREGAYDAVLAMYHDQALIPVKTLDFHGGVNVTMGLPFIRTSVDHGTAFDIAGRGIARPDSLRAALETAAVLVRNKEKSS